MEIKSKYKFLYKFRPKYLEDAETYKETIEDRRMTFEQRKFWEDMKEFTGKPRINRKSKNLKRSINDLYNWKTKKNKENQKLKDQFEMESHQKLQKI